MPAALYPLGLQVADFILSEADGFRSRENAVVTLTGAMAKSGTVLTKRDNAATGTAAATAGNTGNPTFGTINVSNAADPGAYKLTFTAATKFDVEGPNGVKIGTGSTGVAFNKGGLSFTLTAGGTPAVAGDEWTITVAAGTGKYVPYTAAGADGTADAVLYTPLAAGTGDFKAVVIADAAEVRRSMLIGLDATAEANLRRRGIKVRGTAGLAGVSTPAL